MSKASFPNVPPGDRITDYEAMTAAKNVRRWYQNDGATIESDSIVTVVRWALHRMHPPKATEAADAPPEPTELRKALERVIAAYESSDDSRYNSPLNDAIEAAIAVLK